MNTGINVNIRRGEIYDIGHLDTVGSEQHGDRPVLIVSDDDINRKSPETTVCFITSRLEKKGEKYHVNLPGGAGLNKKSMVLTEQLRTIDKSRLISKRGQLDATTMSRVDRGLKNSLGLLSAQQKTRRKLKGRKQRVHLEWRSRKEYRNTLISNAKIVNKREIL